MMNLFRFAGDMCHICSIIVLLLRLRVTKNAIGISVKTQELYLLVFVTRYLDLFTTYYSLYNSVMKVIYISLTALIIYTVRYTEPFKTNYDNAQDSFLHWKFAVAPVAVLALITNIYQGFDFIEVGKTIFFFAFIFVCLSKIHNNFTDFLKFIFIYTLVVLGIFHLLGSFGDCSAAYYPSALPRGRELNRA